MSKPETTKGWLEGWVMYAYGCQTHTAKRTAKKVENEFSNGFQEGLAVGVRDMLDAFMTFTSPANRRKAMKIIQEMQNVG